MGEKDQLVLDLVQGVEINHAIGPASQFADRLRPTEQEHRDERRLTRVESQRLGQHMAIAHGRASMGGQDEADEFLLLEHSEGRQHGVFVVVDHRVAVRRPGCMRRQAI